ncbi:MAG: hypothetical protein A2085_07455 [Gemmatimonadetes bacterium GWC2_71_10]|nr:MAG: hypothetical protein A2085_07455 [Gemmatimonadetes bacterium GWC2_71_10]
MSDETYDPARINQLLGMLRGLATRIQQLDAEGRLLQETPALLRELGEIRRELFQYEVRSTFDTPDAAESRRIVDEARDNWVPDDNPDDDEEEPWRRGE